MYKNPCRKWFLFLGSWTVRLKNQPTFSLSIDFSNYRKPPYIESGFWSSSLAMALHGYRWCPSQPYLEMPGAFWRCQGPSNSCIPLHTSWGLSARYLSNRLPASFSLFSSGSQTFWSLKPFTFLKVVSGSPTTTFMKYKGALECWHMCIAQCWTLVKSHERGSQEGLTNKPDREQMAVTYCVLM